MAPLTFAHFTVTELVVELVVIFVGAFIEAACAGELIAKRIRKVAVSISENARKRCNISGLTVGEGTSGLLSA